MRDRTNWADGPGAVGVIYVVRHCSATGQEPEAPLNPAGDAQAEVLADVLAPLGIDAVVSSPFVRARCSIEPLARRLGLEIGIDPRLAERVLGDCGDQQWQDALKAAFADPDRCYPGGESGRAAADRAVAAFEAAGRAGSTPVLVTHGNLLTLLLGRFDAAFGFDAWQALTNPDVFRIEVGDGGVQVARVWRPDGR